MRGCSFEVVGLTTGRWKLTTPARPEALPHQIASASCETLYTCKRWLNTTLTDLELFKHSASLCAHVALSTTHFMYAFLSEFLQDLILHTLDDIAAGLEYIHNKNIIHGDLK